MEIKKPFGSWGPTKVPSPVNDATKVSVWSLKSPTEVLTSYHADF